MNAAVRRVCMTCVTAQLFAILERWYRTGADLHAKLPHLATYLGHVNPVSTHHYLHFTPELQQAASRRFHDYAFRIFACGGVR